MGLPSMRYSELARERVVAVRGDVLKGIRTACGIREFPHWLPPFYFIYRCCPRPAFTHASTPRWHHPLRGLWAGLRAVAVQRLDRTVPRRTERQDG